jgi:1-acyl-sn-glycerol-3-phosphate acyltransferase
MKVQVCGFDGPLARATRAELERRGHTVTDQGAGCAIFFPGPKETLERLLGNPELKRLVLRSHAFAYGSSTKNPGLMTEERVSLLPENAPERRWLQMEDLTARHPSAAAVRLTNVLDPAEGDVLVRQLSSSTGVSISGHDPNVQFISVADAARAMALAAESQATGIFNAAGGGVIPLKKAFRASASRRLPLMKPLAKRYAGGDSIDQLQYNWTVSGSRAARELGFVPRQSSVEALAEFLKTPPDRLLKSYDDWGLDLDYIRAWSGWFSFLRNLYWRIDHEGVENIPLAGRGMFVSNHRGFMPLDAVMHLAIILKERQRVTRFLIINSLLRFPFLCNFLTKLGGVIASQENAARLFEGDNLVGIFPEGIRGAFMPYGKTYKLRDFAKGAFAKIAIENQSPVLPAAVIGHAEIFPIIGRIDSEWVKRELGWPYLPIAPMFPLAPIPIPSKWHIRYLPAVSLGGLKPADAENQKLVREFSYHVQNIVQVNIDDMVKRRKSIFFGKVLDGTAPQAPPFEWPLRHATRGGGVA